MHTANRLVIAALVCVALGSCKRHPPPEDRRSTPAADAKPSAWKTPSPAKIEWTSPTEFKLADTHLVGLVSLLNLDYDVTLFDVPAGAKASIGKVSIPERAKNEVSAKVTIDLAPGFGALPLKQALSYDEVELGPSDPLVITFPDGAKVEVPLKKQKTHVLVDEVLKRLADGKPVPFGDNETAPKRHSIYYIGYLGAMPEDKIIGPAKNLGDVDWVAIHSELPKRQSPKKCPGYKKSDSDPGPGETYELVLVDWEVTLYERSSAKVIEKKKFESDGLCPLIATNGGIEAWPNDDAIKAWLRGKRGP